MNEKSRIMALVMTALLVIGAFTAFAPVMSGTSVSNNTDPLITTQTVDPGDTVKLMNFTIGAGGDQHIAGYSISPGTALLEYAPSSWTNNNASRIMYHDPSGPGAWDGETDILAFDDDTDGQWTEQADVSLAGLSITQAAALTGATDTNPFTKVMFKDYTTGWQSGQDAIIYDKDGDGVYSAMADTVINTGDDSAVDVTAGTNVSSMPAGYYMTSGKDDVVNNDYDGDMRFTAQPDKLLSVNGTTSNESDGVKDTTPNTYLDVSEGDDLTQFETADNLYLLDIDGDGEYFDTGQIFIFLDAGTTSGEFDSGDSVVLDQNATNYNWAYGMSGLDAQNRNTRLKFYDGDDDDTWDDGEDIVLDDGGYNTYSTREDTVINDGGSREIANKDILQDITSMYAGSSPMFADLDESSYTYTAGDEIFLDNDGDTSYTAEADDLLAGTAPSNGITLTNTNPWSGTADTVNFFDKHNAGQWEANHDCIFLDYHDGGTVSVGADTYIAGNTTGEDGSPLTAYDETGTPPWDLDFYNMYPGGEWTVSQDAIVEDADANNVYQDVVTGLSINNPVGTYPLGLESDDVTFDVWMDMKPSDGHNASDTANETMLGNPTWDPATETWDLSLSQNILMDTTIHVFMDTSSDITGDPSINPEATVSLVSGDQVLSPAGDTVTVEGPPGVQWARTADDDNDGMVDAIHVNYTELMGVTGIGTLNDVTFDNATIVDLSKDETHGTTLIKYELANQKPPEWTSYADFDETFITDNDGNNLAAGQDQPVVDWIGPYIESCEVEPGAKTVMVTFSEDVTSYGTGTYDGFSIMGAMSGLSVSDWSLSGQTQATLVLNGQVPMNVPSTALAATSWINTGQGVRDGVAGTPILDTMDEYSLVEGWNVVSIPRQVSGTLDVVDNASGVISNTWAFDAENQEWVHSTTVEPLDAVFVYAEGPQYVTFTYKTPEPTDTPPTKDMYAGWNFIGPNMDPTAEITVQVDMLLASVGGQYSVVFSPGFNHGGSWTVTPQNDHTQNMDAFEGYWVYMNTDGTLAGRSA